MYCLYKTILCALPSVNCIFLACLLRLLTIKQQNSQSLHFRNNKNKSLLSYKTYLKKKKKTPTCD